MITDEVIGESDDEKVLRDAAEHINLLLDCLEVERNIKLYFDIKKDVETPFEYHQYFELLSKLDFPDLIALMNAKVDLIQNKAQ